MNSTDRAAELRALADQHDELGAFEDAYERALEAYRADMSEENKATYTQAADDLRVARQGIRESKVMVASNEPGSTTIGGAGVGKASVGEKPAETQEAEEL